MSYLRYLCLFAYSVVIFLFCLSSSCVLCTQCCQFLWIVHFFIASSLFSNVYLFVFYVLNYIFYSIYKLPCPSSILILLLLVLFVYQPSNRVSLGTCLEHMANQAYTHRNHLLLFAQLHRTFVKLSGNDCSCDHARANTLEQMLFPLQASPDRFP